LALVISLECFIYYFIFFAYETGVFWKRMHPPRGIEFLGNFSQCMLVEVSRILEGAHVRHVA